MTAPTGGRIGHIQVAESNYVTNGVTALISIISVDPLYVYFDADERTYLQALAPTRGEEGEQAPRAKMALLTDEFYGRSSRLDLLANAADRGTGTARVRAVVSNPDGQLTPGLFVKVRLETGKPREQVLVADHSVGTDQGRRCVLVVNEGNKAQYRPVELGPMIDGLQVVRQGLQPGERIVVKGLVWPGIQVTPLPAKTDGTPVDLPKTAGAVR